MVRSTEAAKQMPLTTVTVSRRRLAVLCLDRTYREKIYMAPGPIPNAPQEPRKPPGRGSHPYDGINEDVLLAEEKTVGHGIPRRKNLQTNKQSPSETQRTDTWNERTDRHIMPSDAASHLGASRDRPKNTTPRTSSRI